jgi:hypothetical protein
MKQITMPNSIILVGLLLAFFTGGCFSDEGADKTSTPVYGKSQVFRATDNDYVLSDILFAPKYDSSTSKGYAVIFLMREPTAPIRFSMGGGGGPTSLVDLHLIDSENTISSRNMGFARNGDDTKFQGKMVVYFSLKKEKEFPSKGVFTRKEDNNAVTSYQIDLSGIQITGSMN